MLEMMRTVTMAWMLQMTSSDNVMPTDFPFGESRRVNARLGIFPIQDGASWVVVMECLVMVVLERTCWCIIWFELWFVLDKGFGL
jgi:hypothetical protein